MAAGAGTYGWINNQQYVYDDQILSWVPATHISVNLSTQNLELNTDQIEGKLDLLLTNTQLRASAVGVAITPLQLTIASGSVSASGNNTLITPTTGMKIRLYYVAYNPSAAAEIGFRFGAAGTLFLRNSITSGGAVIAKDFGDLRYVQGTTNEALVLNLSAAVSTIWNAFYVEVA